MDQPTSADPSEYGEHIADVYDQWFPAAAEQLTPMVDFLARHAAGGPALELGVGTGRVALPLAARGGGGERDRRLAQDAGQAAGQGGRRPGGRQPGELRRRGGRRRRAVPAGLRG